MFTVILFNKCALTEQASIFRLHLTFSICYGISGEGGWGGRYRRKGGKRSGKKCLSSEISSASPIIFFLSFFKERDNNRNNIRI